MYGESVYRLIYVQTKELYFLLEFKWKLTFSVGSTSFTIIFSWLQNKQEDLTDSSSTTSINKMGRIELKFMMM